MPLKLLVVEDEEAGREREREEHRFWRDQVKAMFEFSFDSYRRHAFPSDELLPLSCAGAETYGNYSLSLIDALDTLLVFGKHQGFLIFC